MKIKNVILSLLLVVSTSIFAQSHIDKQVDNAVAKINERLTSVSQKLKLNKEQEAEVKELQKAFILERKEIAKQYEDKEELKEVLKPKRQALNKKVRALLDEKQLEAFKATWKKK